MNNRDELFRKMQDELSPSEEAENKLRERLKTAKPHKISVRPVYVAAAACLAIIAIAVPTVLHLAHSTEDNTVKLHSYEVSGTTGTSTFTDDTAVADTGAGGIITDDITDDIAEDDLEVETEETATEADSNLEKESTQPTITTDVTEDWEDTEAESDEPDPSVDIDIEDMEIDIAAEEPAYDQDEALMAYLNLMSNFAATYGEDRYPDWYGGAYIDNDNLLESGGGASIGKSPLVVMIAEGSTDDEKALCIEVCEIAGTYSIVFSDAKYNLNYLRELQKKVEALPELEGLSWWGCGSDERNNRVELTVPSVDDALLAALAELDPDDDAIHVIAGIEYQTVDDEEYTVDDEGYTVDDEDYAESGTGGASSPAYDPFDKGE